MFTVLATLLGLLFTLSGSSKIQKKPVAVAAAEKLGYTNILTQIGILEMVGGMAAVIFTYLDFHIIAFLAVIGLNAMMAGAVVFHVKANDAKGAIPAAVLFALGVLALSGYGA
ncbi:MAG: DoxX-like family [Actinomycetota bacterium]|jgi:hypothetical protein